MAPSPPELARKTETTSGTKAAAATRALSLFSNNSIRSNGFLSAAGSAVPSESFKKQAASSDNAGTQKRGRANQGNWDRLSLGVEKYFHTPTAVTRSEERRVGKE